MFSIFAKKQPEKLWFTTDIHCHIVPGIDDGSPSAAYSVELVNRMMQWGISRIIATPHVAQDSFENTPETISGAFGVLTKALSAAGVGIDISHSAEYRMDELFVSHLEQGIIMPFPNSHILVENSFIQEAWGIDRIILDMRRRGYKPILAHPERYAYYYDNPDRYRVLHSRGLLFQVNLLSLAGHYGKPQKKIAEQLIEAGLVDLIGTDLHRTAHADSIDAYLRSKDYARHRRVLDGRILNDSLFC